MLKKLTRLALALAGFFKPREVEANDWDWPANQQVEHQTGDDIDTGESVNTDDDDFTPPQGWTGSSGDYRGHTGAQGYTGTHWHPPSGVTFTTSYPTKRKLRRSYRPPQKQDGGGSSDGDN